MMVNQYWSNRSDSQVRIASDALQYVESFAAAQIAPAKFPGWMFWKKYPNGREYLVHALDRTGKGTTLGARAVASERVFAEFNDQQTAAKTQLALAKGRVAAQARFVKAAKLNRLPRQAAAVMRALSDTPNGGEYVVVGTHALYAYEALADVTILPFAMETQDIDVLWDARKRVQTIVDDASLVGALGALKSMDNTYTTNTEKTFQARNSDGFVVDFLRAELPKEPPLIEANDRINPISLPGLDWLLKQTQAVTLFDYQGFPITFIVPDPRLYAAHKLWLSQRTDRAPGKRDRDRMQSALVAALVLEREPVLLPLDTDDLQQSVELFAAFKQVFSD